jgi:hypothetical protein
MSAEFNMQNRDSVLGYSSLLKPVEELTSYGTISNPPETFLSERQSNLIKYRDQSKSSYSNSI